MKALQMRFVSSTLVLGCLLMAVQSMARPITWEKAQRNAMAFLLKRGRSVALSSLRHSTTELSPYYVYNVGDDGGFVIASGDDCAPAVLGYADCGHLDVNDMPCNMQAWLDGYALQIQALQERGVKAPQVPQIATTQLPAIAPMLTSMWSQDYPYNLSCPEVGGYHCLTGCVATALAQVMYYHRARSVSQTTHEIKAYVTNTLGLNIDAIPAGSPIDWDNMIDDYDNEPTEAQCQAVATLMKYCGAALKMNYGLGVSTASANILEVVMSLYFNYSHKARYVYPSYYTDEEWAELIHNELSNGRPVLYSGYAEGMGGHTFVCDGYEGNGYFHINWGWGGDGNGYFLFKATSGDDTDVILFKRNQGAVLGVEPLPEVVDPEEGMHFVDPVMRYIGLRNWDTNDDGWLSMEEVTAVTDFQLFYDYYLASFFLANSLISFEEFKYFTGVTRIDIGAFLDCEDISRISLPNAVTVIGGSAFLNCSSLASIILPQSVTLIGEDAFGGTTNLTRITCLAATPPELETGALGQENPKAILIVPVNAVEAYRSASGWNRFNHIFGLDPSLGDVNLDGEVTIADINVIIDTVLNDVNDCLNEYMSDVNGDGEVNIADINVTVDKVLNSR